MNMIRPGATELNAQTSPFTVDAVAGPEAKYRAPALEKGLDILELLAAEGTPLTLAQISSRLSRSMSEIFRMAHVLEVRGYIASTGRQQGFELTDKCFALGIMQDLHSRLLSAAAPVMKALSDTTGHACHLSVASEDQVIVIFHVLPESGVAFSMRTGSRQPLRTSAAGAVLCAFNPKREQTASVIRQGADLPSDAWAQNSKLFQDTLAKARMLGYCVAQNPRVKAVTDIAVPIKVDQVAVAALTATYMRYPEALNLDLTTYAVGNSATDLSKALKRIKR